MSWEETAKQYEARLGNAVDVLRHARQLAELPQADAGRAETQQLADVKRPAEIQLARLRRREFRMAVVGLEKAGKSTFVNAWLEADILPNDDPRCTYSTTQIQSVSSESKQRLEITAKNRQAFEAMAHELEQKAKGSDDAAKNARKDLETIQRCRATLDALIREGDKTMLFERLEDIEPDLKKYIADERYAHAVQEVRLYTSMLAATDGVVFFDVPGLDSGLGKHLEDSEAMLRDCDAVICVQRSLFPSLKAGEQQLIEFIKKGDQAVGLEDKLFVFFGSIDLKGSAASLRDALEEAKREWQRYGLQKSERIIPGSAAAYLLLKGAAGKTLLKNVGGRDKIIAALKEVTGADGDGQIERATGIPAIKEAVASYLKNERAHVLRKRCDALIESIMKPSRILYRQIAERFPEDPEEAKKHAEEHRIERLFEWWTTERWNEIQTALGTYYKILTETGEGIKRFEERYLTTVQDAMRQLPSRQEKRREALFGTKLVSEVDWSENNYQWREKLSAEIMEMIETIAKELSGEIIQECDELIRYISTLLWGVAESRISQKIILSRQELESRLRHGLQTLFLRFARPVARALIDGPFDSQRRREIVRRLGVDMELLDPYYEGDEPAYESLKKFVRYGRALLIDPRLRKEVLGVDAQIKTEIPHSTEDIATTDLSKERLIAEVEADLQALEVYLKKAVFAAAGFLAYRNQELFTLCQRFYEKEFLWREMLRHELYAGNPVLLKDVPKECLGQTYDLEVCERLRQLRIALDKFDSGVGL